MANPKKRAPENAPGDFFVGSTCIDCDAYRPPAAVGTSATFPVMPRLARPQADHPAARPSIKERW
jgi:hypothetical protein